MAGKKDLLQIIHSLGPELDPKSYVYCTVAHESEQFPRKRWATILEEEGITLILTKGDADANGIEYEGIWRRITCKVHSSLDAVGLTALISTRLADRGIPANIVAGYHHDHVFVPEDRSIEALHILENLETGNGLPKILAHDLPIDQVSV